SAGLNEIFDRYLKVSGRASLGILPAPWWDVAVPRPAGAIDPHGDRRGQAAARQAPAGPDRLIPGGHRPTDRLLARGVPLCGVPAGGRLTARRLPAGGRARPRRFGPDASGVRAPTPRRGARPR